MLFECLESRRLMSATADLVNGIVTVQGDNGDDLEVLVEENAEQAGLVHVTIGTEVMSWSNAEGIFIDLGEGEAGVQLIVRTLPAIVRTGSGIDIIQVENYNTAEAVAVSSGGSTDLLSVFDFGSYGSAVMAGDGDDGVKVFTASLNSVRPTLVFGGDGADFLEGSGFYSLTEDDPNTPENEFEEVYDAGVGFCELYGDRDDDEFWTYNADTRISGGSGADVATIYLDALQKVKTSSIQDLQIVVVS